MAKVKLARIIVLWYWPYDRTGITIVNYYRKTSILPAIDDTRFESTLDLIDNEMIRHSNKYKCFIEETSS